MTGAGSTGPALGCGRLPVGTTTTAWRSTSTRPTAICRLLPWPLTCWTESCRPLRSVRLAPVSCGCWSAGGRMWTSSASGRKAGTTPSWTTGTSAWPLCTCWASTPRRRRGCRRSSIASAPPSCPMAAAPLASQWTALPSGLGRTSGSCSLPTRCATSLALISAARFRPGCDGR